MAIILPNTRNAIGVPNRYSDLAAAGLRYTPPPVYRYDAYDVQGDTATLYEEDIDLADYRYNADSYDAAVLPQGYSAITGGDGKFLIGAADTKLYYHDAGGIGLPTGSPSGLTAIAYNGDGYGCLSINAGALYAYAVSNGSVITHLIDNTREWTAISCCPDYPKNAIGVADGKLMGIRSDYGDFFLYALSSATGWKIAGGVRGEDFVSFSGSRISSAVINASGYLHQVWAEADYSPINGDPANGYSVVGVPFLGSALTTLGDGWVSVSGYMKEVAEPGPYGDTFPYVTSASRMYGIQAGLLFSLRHALSVTLGAPSKTQITEFSDWWKVVFLAPDEAVAIRRIEL